MPTKKTKNLSSTRKIQRHRQITIPKEMFEGMGLSEGDYVEILEDKGKLVLIPKKLIDKDQAWFWTKEWQKGEAKAEEDIRKGRLYGPFDSVEEMKKDFEKRKNE